MTNNNFGRDYGQQAATGTVAVDPASLAALETTTVNQGSAGPLPWPVLEASRAAAAADVHAPAANTAAVVTYAAGGAGVSHVIGGIAWSYSGVPTGGNLKIEDGSGIIVFSIDIVAAGAGVITLPRPKKGTANTAMIITLAAGGAGVSGKVNATAHWLET